MSGGLYGRGKAPERTCLKPKDWPDEERRVWEKACEPADDLKLDIGARVCATGFRTKSGVDTHVLLEVASIDML